MAPVMEIQVKLQVRFISKSHLIMATSRQKCFTIIKVDKIYMLKPRQTN